MPYATQWWTPAPPRPSGSSIRSAKLFVPSGTPVHASCGDTFSPTQFGLFGVLLATFFGISWPSLKVLDVRVNGSAAAAPAANARIRAPAAIRCRTTVVDDIFPPDLKMKAPARLRAVRNGGA